MYEDLSYCIWSLTGTAGHNTIRFDFDWFDTFPHDDLVIHVGDSVTTLSGLGNATQWWPTLKKTFNKDDLINVTFKTGSQHNGRGWQFRWEFGTENATETVTVVEEQASLGVGAWVGIGIAIAAFLAIVALLVVLLLRKRKSNTLVAPDYQKLFEREMYSELIEAHSLWTALPSKNRTKKTELFEDLVKKFPLLAVVLSEFSFDHRLSSYLAVVLEYYSVLGRGLIRLAQHDIEKTGTVNTLFREDTAFTRCYAVFVKLHGMPFAWQVLAEPIQEYLKSTAKAKDHLLFDQMNGAGTASIADAYGDILRLKDVANKILINFLKCLDQGALPAPICYLVQQLGDSVRAQFPEHKFQAITALIFLRFVCVAIAQPKEWGLIPDEWRLTHLQRRSLVLLAKVITNLASLSLFEGDGFIQELNEFIQKSAKPLKRGFTALLAQQFKENTLEGQSEVVTVSSKTKRACVYRLYAEVGREKAAFAQAVQATFGRFGEEISFAADPTTMASVYNSSDFPTTRNTQSGGHSSHSHSHSMNSMNSASAMAQLTRTTSSSLSSSSHTEFSSPPAEDSSLLSSSSN